MLPSLRAPNKLRGSPVALGLGALAAFGLAAVLLWRASIDDKQNRSADGGAARFPQRRTVPETSSRPSVPAGSSLIGSLSSPATDEGSTEFDQFMALLTGAAARAPAPAKAFKQEFMSSPALKKDWDNFERSQKGPPPHQTFQGLAERLMHKAEFRRLTGRFAQDPGFRQVMLALSREPAMKGVVHGLWANARGFASPGRRRGFSGSTSRNGVVAPVTSASTVGGFSGAAPAQGAPPAAGARARGPGARYSEPPGGEDGSGLAKGSDVFASETGGAGDSGREAVGLDKLKKVGPEMNARDYIASLCYRNDPSITKRQCESIETALGDNDLWTACQITGNLGTCADVCLTKPSAGCSQQARNIQSCMAAGGSQAGCTANCAASADCLSPSGATSGPPMSSSTPTPTPTPPPACDADCQADARCTASHPSADFCFYLRRNPGGHCCCYDKDGNPMTMGCPF